MGGRLTIASRWRSVAASVTGSSHRARGEPCQDAVVVRDLGSRGLAVAVADGAGSACRADEGSMLATCVAIGALDAGASVEDAFELARASLGTEQLAAARATTLLVAVIDDARCARVAQVGDGFVVARTGADADASYSVVCAGPEREYLNETTFLSSARWRDDFRVDDVNDVEALALLTDGLQLVAIDLATTTPHAPFFDPLFEWAASEDASETELAAFLGSDRVSARTDDDLTLALVVPR
jgi:hypothetical protein